MRSPRQRSIFSLPAAPRARSDTPWSSAGGTPPSAISPRSRSRRAPPAGDSASACSRPPKPRRAGTAARACASRSGPTTRPRRRFTRRPTTAASRRSPTITKTAPPLGATRRASRRKGKAPLPERLPSRTPIEGPCQAAAGTERLLDAQHLVPFRHPLGAGEGADLELAGVPADRQVGDRHVLGLAGPGRDDRGEACRLPGVERRLGLGDGAGLVRLDQHRVAGAGPRRLAHAIGVRDEEIVADDMELVSERRREAAKPFRVVLGQGVFDRDDRVALDPAPEHPDHAVGVELALLQCETIAPAAPEL